MRNKKRKGNIRFYLKKDINDFFYNGTRDKLLLKSYFNGIHEIIEGFMEYLALIHTILYPFKIYQRIFYYIEFFLTIICLLFGLLFYFQQYGCVSAKSVIYILENLKSSLCWDDLFYPFLEETFLNDTNLNPHIYLQIMYLYYMLYFIQNLLILLGKKENISLKFTFTYFIVLLISKVTFIKLLLREFKIKGLYLISPKMTSKNVFYFTYLLSILHAILPLIFLFEVKLFCLLFLLTTLINLLFILLEIDFVKGKTFYEQQKFVAYYIVESNEGGSYQMTFDSYIEMEKKKLIGIDEKFSYEIIFEIDEDPGRFSEFLSVEDLTKYFAVLHKDISCFMEYLSKINVILYKREFIIRKIQEINIYIYPCILLLLLHFF